MITREDYKRYIEVASEADDEWLLGYYINISSVLYGDPSETEWERDIFKTEILKRMKP